MIVFPEVTKPQASVLIVALRDAELLLECLGSIAENVEDATYEVIVVLNDPSARLCKELERDVRGAHIAVFRANLGFGGAVNYAASQARGEYLVLTNDDCEVSPGWLESLIDTVERRPCCGLVGSRLFNSDGTLQEAGAVIWSDGITSPILDERAVGLEGRVDYCSAASLLVRKEVWSQLGGFDDSYYPGYYEDVDLCLRSLDAGWEVWHQPQSVVYHQRSRSTTELERGFLWQRGRRIFTERWSEFLAHQQPNGAFESAIREAMNRPLPAILTDKGGADRSSAKGFESTSELEVAALRRELELRFAYDAWLEQVAREREQHHARRDDSGRTGMATSLNFRRLLDRIGFSQRNPGAMNLASMSDVTTAYRLFLQREPDREGERYYAGLVSSGALTFEDLAAALLNSAEFARLHPQSMDPKRSTPAEVAADDFVILVNSSDWAVGAAIATGRPYEPDVTATVRSLVSPGSVFVDIGANVGWFSLLAARIVGSSGKVIAIEPNPHNCSLLVQSCVRNAFTNVEVVTAAVADAQRWSALETDASNGRILPLAPIESSTEPIECSYVVPVFTLDQILSDSGSIDAVSAVKIDVEGVEDQVFGGAEHLLTSTRPTIIFEWFPEALRSTGGVEPAVPLSRLRNYGYVISIVGHPGPDDRGAGLSNEEIEAVRLRSGRNLLELLARHPGQSCD